MVVGKVYFPFGKPYFSGPELSLDSSQEGKLSKAIPRGEKIQQVFNARKFTADLLGCPRNLEKTISKWNTSYT